MAKGPIWMEEDGFGNVPPVSKHAHGRAYDYTLGLIAQGGLKKIRAMLPFWARSTGSVGENAFYEEHPEMPPENRRDEEAEAALEGFRERMANTTAVKTREYALYCLPVFMPRVVLRGKSGRPLIRGGNTLNLLVSRHFLHVITDTAFSFEVEANLSKHGYKDIPQQTVEVKLTCVFFGELWGYPRSASTSASYRRFDQSNEKDFKWDSSKTQTQLYTSLLDEDSPRGIFYVPALYPKWSPDVLLPYERISTTTALYRMRWSSLMASSMFKGPDGPDVYVKWVGDYIPPTYEIANLLSDRGISGGMVNQAEQIRNLLPAGESGLYYDKKGNCIGIAVNSDTPGVRTSYEMKFPSSLMNPSIYFSKMPDDDDSWVVENVSNKERPVKYYKEFLGEGSDDERVSAEGKGVVNVAVDVTGDPIQEQVVEFDVTVKLKGVEGWWLTSVEHRANYEVQIPVANMDISATTFILYYKDGNSEESVASIVVPGRSVGQFSFHPFEYGFGDEDKQADSASFKIVTTAYSVGVIGQASFDGYTRRALDAGGLPTFGTRKIYSLRKKLAIDDWDGTYPS